MTFASEKQPRHIQTHAYFIVRGSIRRPRYFFCERAFPGKENYKVLLTTRIPSFGQSIKDTKSWIILTIIITAFSGASGWLSRLSIQLLVSAQVMISWFRDSSPGSGSALTVQGLGCSLSLPLSLPLPCSCCLCLSQNK